MGTAADGQGREPVARMAKSADAADLKSADRKVVGVQVPLRAPVHASVSARVSAGVTAYRKAIDFAAAEIEFIP